MRNERDRRLALHRGALYEPLFPEVATNLVHSHVEDELTSRKHELHGRSNERKMDYVIPLSNTLRVGINLVHAIMFAISNC